MAEVPENGWTVAEWQAAYRDGRLDPECLRALVDELPGDDPAWISRSTREQLDEQLRGLAARLAGAGGRLDRLPLYGVPFAVKDNIDAAGWNTTAACRAFAYTAREDACVVERLKAAGAILVGKTNLDQFATGLAGNRSPYGAVPNPFDARYVSGGSSSGSASVVARGLVPFTLGTDTAGSGRVPAGFNNIVGFKPTRGRSSNHGVVPACRTLDCVSVFGATVGDTELIVRLTSGIDSRDPYTRVARADLGAPGREGRGGLRLAVPDALEFFGDTVAAAAFGRDCEALREQGVELVELAFGPFRELARLLYEGPWIAERYLVLRELLETNPGAVHPAVALLVQGARRFTASDVFAAEYERARLARRLHEALASFDALLVPTAPRFYTLAEVEADPIETITRLGYYTNFANLGDLCALALPGSFRSDGLPAGLTLLAPAWHDDLLVDIGCAWESRLEGRLGATRRSRAEVLSRSRSLDAWPGSLARDEIRLAVVGAHLRGMPLNHQLTQRGGRLLQTTRTAPRYQLFALRDTHPAKPGLVRSDSGSAIEVEVWSLSTGHFGDFVAEVPPPLGIGNVELADGTWVKGFICEPHALDGSRDITPLGGWRAFLAADGY